MTTPEPRFRVVDKTPPDHPKFPTFYVEEWREGAWRLALFDAMFIAFDTSEKAERVAAKLEAGECIADEMKRVPVEWWKKPGWDPSAPFTRRS